MSKKKIISRAIDNARVAAACMTGGSVHIHAKEGITTVAIDRPGRPNAHQIILDKRTGTITSRKTARTMTRLLNL